MRFDTTGLFWNDYKPPKVSKAREKVQRIPPEPVWLAPDYLPYWEECADWEPDEFTDAELLEAKHRGERLVWDTESYPNYWAAGFLSVDSGKCLIFEDAPNYGLYLDKSKLDWVLRNFTLIDFNGEYYDRHVAAVAVKPGTDSEHMWTATERIIQYKERGWQVVKAFGARKIEIDHIDLIELTPLAPSLKVMAGRLGSSLMMDLPYAPGTYLTYEQTRVVRWYMFNDNRNTELVYRAHAANIKLREEFGPKYNVDLRSRSDAQMAESIFRREVFNRTGRFPEPPGVRPGHTFKFQMPDWVQFQTPELQWLKQAVIDATFEINESGYVIEPEAFKKLLVPIGGMEYSFGVGGLHSTEESIAHSAYEGGEIRWILRDHDVASYYPKLILNTGMYPPAIGPIFRPIFSEIVDRRLVEKAKDKKGVWALGLKIVVNGSFGKTMDPWSVLYCPELGMQTTISGQLALFMMIERVHLAGMQITNANTDGVVVKCPKERESELQALVKDWEHSTGLQMEPTDYVATFSRDVNNYIAIDKKGNVKRKGFYGLSAVAVKDPDNEQIKKNPQTEIASDAIVEFLSKGTPIADTVRSCTDINKFVTVRNAKGGGAWVKKGEQSQYLGKVARWIHTTDKGGEIVTVNKGYLVATSENSTPVMRYDSESILYTIDYDHYEKIAYESLALLGYYELIGQPRPELTT